MRDYSATELAYLQNRSSYVAHGLVWFAARNRSTNAVETLGVWTGDDDQIFNIGGDLRTYFGAGQIVGLDAIAMSVGLVVRSQRIRLTSFSPAAQQLLLGYDLGLAPAQIHRAFFYPDTGGLVAEPRRVWKGFVDKAPLPTAEIGGDAPAEVVLVSAARALTRGLTLTLSDKVMRQRSGDRFLRHSTVSGVVRSPWGASMPQEPQPKPAPPPRTGGQDHPNGGR